MGKTSNLQQYNIETFTYDNEILITTEIMISKSQIRKRKFENNETFIHGENHSLLEVKVEVEK